MWCRTRSPGPSSPWTRCQTSRRSAPGCSELPTTAHWTCCAAAQSAPPSRSRQPERSPIRRVPILWRRREAVETAVSRFVELPTVQRSVVILKDVLDQSLEEIADMLDLTVNAVKAHLSRGRARLKVINAQAPAQLAPQPPSPAVARYVALFNRRDWDGLRGMLADDVRLIQSSYPLRVGAA